MCKLSASELVTQHMPALSTSGTAITATFADPAVSQAFFEVLLKACSDGRARRDDASAPEAGEDIPQDVAASAAEVEAQDDLRELAHVHARLDRADDRIRRQQRQINTIMATYVERAHLRTGRFPSYCCQRCGEAIGWTGRAFQAVGLGLHTCTFAREAD